VENYAIAIVKLKLPTFFVVASSLKNDLTNIYPINNYVEETTLKTYYFDYDLFIYVFIL
jgi:hypothetical protein